MYRPKIVYMNEVNEKILNDLQGVSGGGDGLPGMRKKCLIPFNNFKM